GPRPRAVAARVTGAALDIGLGHRVEVEQHLDVGELLDAVESRRVVCVSEGDLGAYRSPLVIDGRSPRAPDVGYRFDDDHLASASGLPAVAALAKLSGWPGRQAHGERFHR